MRRLIDSHVHIDGFSDIDLIKQESEEAGIDAVLCVGGDIESSGKALDAAGRFPEFFFPAVGVHPSNILKTDLVQAEEFISDNISRCVALGEVGLDYAYDFAKPKEVRAKMRSYLERLLMIAADVGVPASVHSRSAYRDTLDLVAASGVEAVFHWYDGPVHTLRRLLDEGFYVSATPAVEYSKGARAVMLEAPLERILVETDSPVFVRSLGRLSSPVDVVRVVDALAELKDLDPVEVARVTSRNAESLFRI
jgi:TatD DNase family protein